MAGNSTYVRCVCPSCGEIKLPPASVFVCAYRKPNAYRSTYRFTCPQCSEEHTKRLEPLLIKGLIDSGCPYAGLEVSRELQEDHHASMLEGDGFDLDLDYRIDLGLDLAALELIYEQPVE